MSEILEPEVVTVMIGNSDNKLTQCEWASFVQALRYRIIDINTYCENTYFSGGSPAEDPWQNYCIVATPHEGMIPQLKQELKELMTKPYFSEWPAIRLLKG